MSLGLGGMAVSVAYERFESAWRIADVHSVLAVRGHGDGRVRNARGTVRSMLPRGMMWVRRGARE